MGISIEDCWKSFSNDDYDELLNELILSKYSATKSNGEVKKSKIHDINEYVNQLSQINANISSQGTTTMITNTVSNIMMYDGSEESTEYSFDFGFDSNMLSKLIWAVVMPIIESLFTPQVMLLLMINFQLFGIVNVNSLSSGDFSKILKLFLNKIKYMILIIFRCQMVLSGQ